MAFAAKYPTNNKARNIFNELDEPTQQRIRDRVTQLYDGTRTLAACWKQAMDELVTGRIK